jgi:hypothetical protein
MIVTARSVKTVRAIRTGRRNVLVALSFCSDVTANSWHPARMEIQHYDAYDGTHDTDSTFSQRYKDYVRMWRRVVWGTGRKILFFHSTLQQPESTLDTEVAGSI